jgi:hypothetical protein
MSKVEMVKLEVDKQNVSGKEKTGVETREFTLEHASKILSIEKRLGKPRHRLPQNSPYEVTDNGEIIKKSNK